MEIKKSKQFNQQRSYKNFERISAPSPIFPFVNSALIGASSELIIDIHSDNSATEKYGIFTNVRITNTSAQNILFYPNQNRNRGIFIASSSSVVFGKEDLGGGVSSFIVANTSTTTDINANEIRMEIWKEGMTSNEALNTANKLIHNAMRIIRGN